MMLSYIIASTFAPSQQFVCTIFLILAIAVLGVNIYVIASKKKDKVEALDEEDLPQSPAPVKIVQSQKTTTYSKSLTAKLMLSEDSIKEYYVTLVNYILSLKKVNGRMSWANYSFNFGRRMFAKFAIRGKTLFLYLALDPLKFENTKYHVKDASEVKKYESVPLMIKVKSQRGVKFAIELIDILASEWNISKNTTSSESIKIEDYPTSSMDELIEKNLIKVHCASSSFFDQNDDDEVDDINDEDDENVSDENICDKADDCDITKVAVSDDNSDSADNI